MYQVRQKDLEWEVKEEIGGWRIDRAELALGDGVRSEGKVDLAGAYRGETLFEELIGGGQGLTRSKSCEASEEYISGGRDARFGELEDIFFGRVGCEGEAEDDVDRDGNEEEVQRSFGTLGDWAWWWARSDRCIERTICY